jgi:hypothetical protein
MTFKGFYHVFFSARCHRVKCKGEANVDAKCSFQTTDLLQTLAFDLWLPHIFAPF